MPEFTNLAQKTVLIAGLGLIGGSLAKALKKAIPDLKIMALDADPAQLELAAKEGFEGFNKSSPALWRQADIVVLALPTLSLPTIIDELAGYVKADAVITDVGSVKAPVSLAVQKLSPGLRQRFVPGHPIAGSEKSGFAAANSELFQQRNVILTPFSDTNPAAISLINSLWRSVGANVLAMTVERHDEVLAATSHLPHLLAFSIVDVLVKQKQSEDIFRYAAGGFADFSRLASSNAHMWADIFIANATATTQVLDDYIDNLQGLRTTIQQGQHDKLTEVFNRAKNARDKFIARYYKPMENNEKNTTIQAAPELTFQVKAGGTISGEMRVPGDKSISHRAIIFGSLAQGVTRVTGFLEGEDALNTLSAFREMGVTIVGPEAGELTIYGVGMNGLSPPRNPLYMGNSGTAMRLLGGLLSAQSFDSELVGDESLSARPMKRIVDPLATMGARISAGEKGTPPLKIQGTQLTAIDYVMPMASAQVKSCLLLAGMYAKGVTSITEPAPCRDHTERMLKGFAYPVEQDSSAGITRIEGGHKLLASDIDVPGDISSAAFFLVAASIASNSALLLKHVGVNPTRTGIIDLLRLMGADIRFSNERLVGGEPVADLEVRQANLTGIVVPANLIPLAIDEFPVLFIAAACAQGETILHGAEELRVKESDRIQAMADGLTQLGIVTETFDDGIRIQGGQLRGGEVDSLGDHRIAMAFAVAALRANDDVVIRNCANVATSFPGFVELAKSAGLFINASES